MRKVDDGEKKKKEKKKKNKIRKEWWKQAGAELGQAQLKLGLDFNSFNLN